MCEHPRRAALIGAVVLGWSGCGDNGSSATGDANHGDGRAVDAASADAGSDAPFGDAAPPDADAIAPAVVATTPADGDPDVALDAAITVTFSEAIDPATVTGASLVVRLGPDPIAGAIAITGADATFVPDAPLAIDAAYTVTATTAIADAAGNHLGPITSSASAAGTGAACS